jgi:hypothetical protein
VGRPGPEVPVGVSVGLGVDVGVGLIGSMVDVCIGLGEKT